MYLASQEIELTTLQLNYNTVSNAEIPHFTPSHHTTVTAQNLIHLLAYMRPHAKNLGAIFDDELSFKFFVRFSFFQLRTISCQAFPYTIWQGSTDMPFSGLLLVPIVRK